MLASLNDFCVIHSANIYYILTLCIAFGAGDTEQNKIDKNPWCLVDNILLRRDS